VKRFGGRREAEGEPCRLPVSLPFLRRAWIAPR